MGEVHSCLASCDAKRNGSKIKVELSASACVNPSLSSYETKSWASSSASPQEKVGIGAYFKRSQPPDPDGLEVKSFLKNSPAELTKQISVGDCIVEVDKEKVEGWTLSELAERILGPNGSVVECTFRRKYEP